MATEAQPASKSLMCVMAEESKLDEAKYRLIIKNQCFRNTKRPVTEEEALAFLMVAHRYHLDPILNQIYAFMNAGTVVPIVGVDGWASIVNKSKPEFDGCEFETEEREGELYAMTCHMYVKGRSRPVSVTEYLHECFRPTNPWKTMERRMLRNKCFSQSARLCYGITGIYDHDEAQQIIEGEVVERQMIAAPVAKDVPETHEDGPEAIPGDDTPDSEVEPEEAPESEEMEMTEGDYREPGADG